jgi:hypothetical protein
MAMNRTLSIFGLALLLAVALTIGLPASAQAQVIVVQSPPVFAPPPVVTTYSIPRYSYYPGPVVTTYSAYPAAPITTSYSAYPGVVVTGYAAPVVTTYSAPVVAAPPAGVYTTYTYWNGLGIFRPRYVNQTYYTPLR